MRRFVRDWWGPFVMGALCAVLAALMVWGNR
jgi:hypothetical protein